MHVAVALALFFALLAFVLFHTVAEANRIEAAAARRTVVELVKNQADQMALLADDNGFWDDAANAIYQRNDIDFAWNSWGAPTVKERNYQLAAVITADGHTRMAFEQGKRIERDIRSWIGKSYDILSAHTAEQHRGVASLVKTPGGLAMVGISEIFAASESLRSLTPKVGANRIVFVRYLDQSAIALIGSRAKVRGLTAGAAGHPVATHALTDVAGQHIGFLTWIPNRPGMRILGRSLPWILLGIFLHLAIIALLIRNGYFALNDIGRKAYIDSLSELPNRRALRDALDQHFNSNKPAAVALMDLDGFKTINDSFGHHIGDRLICEVSECLRKQVGQNGMIARLGGDEFAVLITGEGEKARIKQITADILESFARPFHIDERTVAVGVSIGIALRGDNAQSGSELLRQADVAMYAAKNAGKMRICWFDVHLDLAKEKALQVENGLREALENDQFELVYQPQFNTQSHEVCTVEALLRWKHPEQGEISAADFVPVAEESGLIDRIGLWVLEQACRDALRWPDQKISINVSAAQLRNPDFAKNVGKLLEEMNFPVEQLQFELTGSILALDSELADKAIESIKTLGVTLVLDDYGASLIPPGWLQRRSFKRVKLDHDLVRAAETDESSRTIVQANVAVARALNMDVIAAGVETEGQADIMRIVGCDELQGWHFSRPLTAQEISDLVEVVGSKASSAA